jgi:hypothetical protein
VADDDDYWTEDDLWPRVGERIGPYVLREREPQRAQRTHLADGPDGRVAVTLFRISDELGPVLPPGLAHATARLLQALRALADPALPEFHAHGVHPPYVWLAADPQAGVPLLEWSASRPWTDVLARLHEAGRAVATVEATGILCDVLAPGHILVGPDDRVIVDVAHGVTAVPLLGPNFPGIEHARHMSPERIRDVPRTHRSTQWALCSIAWTALYHQPPFAGERTIQMFRNTLDGNLVPPPPSAVPREIHEALLRGLAVDPDARWPSLRALLAALVPPLPPPPWYRRLLGR